MSCSWEDMADCFCCPLLLLIISPSFVLCAIIIQRTGIICYSTSAGTSILTKSLVPPTSPAPCYVVFEHYRSQLRNSSHNVFCLRASGVIYSYLLIHLYILWCVLSLYLFIYLFFIIFLFFFSAFCGHWDIDAVNIAQEKYCTLFT